MFNGYNKIQTLNISLNTRCPSRDDNSYFSVDLNTTPTKINFSVTEKSRWNNNISNYGYRLLDG